MWRKVGGWGIMAHVSPWDLVESTFEPVSVLCNLVRDPDYSSQNASRTEKEGVY
jgi:hypothetical protein